ncbi:hypothetical protein TraAM80_02166 [Trypanosoma rangeli]|uniref:Uncharacterized protein n=1 Tax=Trypanosoma rangeli TaxID=5698 RepID=A0A3R7M5K6_TRYRA|nr:uncharacterized protein TraAM80_02166 [Trypanosoma rangeli]RNF09455.1 hypothetical protein TraAM80_02166 [Trypanosoma rangeli]|eukprot:RNF09455.1 hypothetical protein TraAM80_02166 [Trypanosoma rangeli]
MLRCCSSLLCAVTSTEVTFRRALGSQSTLLDLIPVKKPMIEGSLRWFVEENIEVVLVSGVKGISPDAVTEHVRRRAVHLLRQYGEGDAVKGCQALRRCIEESRTVRGLLHRLDLQVRLRLWNSTTKVEGETLSPSPVSPARVADDIELQEECGETLYCSVYGTDAWEPYRHEQHIGDVSTSPSVPCVRELLREALRIVQGDAEMRGRRFAAAVCHEAHLLFSTGTSVTSLHDGTFFLWERASKGDGHFVVEDPALRCLECSTRYTVEMEFLHYEKDAIDTFGITAGTWLLHDDAENVEKRDVPLSMLKDKAGLLHRSRCSEVLSHQTEPLAESRIKSVEDAGSVVRMKTCKEGEFASTLLRSLCSQQILQTLLFYASTEMLCGRLAPVRAEDFVRSCGRLDVDCWLSERGQPITVPMAPRYLLHPDPLLFLLECLPLEFGTRGASSISVGSLRFECHLAITASGRMSTAVGGFSSAATAVSALVPWHLTTFRRPVVVEPAQHLQHKSQTLGSILAAADETRLTDSRGTSDESLQTTSPFAVETIDMEATLKKMGVVSGKFTQDFMEYCDAEGRSIFRFEHMDTLQGIERFVRRLRRSQSACFTSIFVYNNRRALSSIVWRAFAGITPHKLPPYMRRIRIPVPLVSGKFFAIRFFGLLEQEQREYALLSILERYSKDPAQWPLKGPLPCFFNRWRLTRGVIEAILRHDALFRYTLERASVQGQEGKFLLRFYSGDAKTHEAQLEEKRLLPQMRRCLVQYVARWDVQVPSVETNAFLLAEVRSNLSFTCRGFVASLLQNSELLQQKDRETSLELYIIEGVRIRLCAGSFAKQEEAKEVLSRMFLEQHFPELLPVVHQLQRVNGVLSRHTGGKEMLFHCCDNTSERRGYRWELQAVADDARTGTGTVTVLDAAEGASRLDALMALLDKVDCAREAAALYPVARKAKTPATPALVQTIEEYQALLAQRRGMQRITHDYDAERNVLTVRGISDHGDVAGNSATILCVIPLGEVGSVGDIMHRYYRRELGLTDPPLFKTPEELRAVPLKSMYDLCQIHFALPLPPLEDAIDASQEKTGWRVELRLPAKLFALQGLRNVEYVYWGRGKREGRRNVVCNFYMALHGDPPAAVRRILSEALSGGMPSTDSVPSSATVLPATDKRNDIAMNQHTPNNSGGGSSSSSSKAMMGAAGSGDYVKDNNATSRGMCVGQGDTCMYTELMGIICSHFRPHVGHDGVVEFRLSYITGFTGRYVSSSAQGGKWVDLFNVPFRTTIWLPLQLLAVLLSCARRLVPDEELEASLLRSASSWPSLFLDTAQSERRFCTTFLRRYLGLWTFEENDVGVQGEVPGSIYLVERIRRVRGGGFEASLSLLQTPLPPTVTTFSRTLASHRAATVPRAEANMWGAVLQHLPELNAVQPEDADKAVFRAIVRVATDMMV